VTETYKNVASVKPKGTVVFTCVKEPTTILYGECSVCCKFGDVMGCGVGGLGVQTEFT